MGDKVQEKNANSVSVVNTCNAFVGQMETARRSTRSAPLRAADFLPERQGNSCFPGVPFEWF